MHFHELQYKTVKYLVNLVFNPPKRPPPQVAGHNSASKNWKKWGEMVLPGMFSYMVIKRKENKMRLKNCCEQTAWAKNECGKKINTNWFANTYHITNTYHKIKDMSTTHDPITLSPCPSCIFSVSYPQRTEDMIINNGKLKMAKTEQEGGMMCAQHIIK